MDREKVISTLEEIKTQTAGIGLDSAVIAHKFIDKIITMLKEQGAQKFFVDESGKITPLPVVVRCKDCANGEVYTQSWDGVQYVECHAHEEEGYDHEDGHPLDWFCADGKRR